MTTTALSFPGAPPRLSAAWQAVIWLLALFVVLPLTLAGFGWLGSPFVLAALPAYAEPALSAPLGADELGRNLCARTLMAGGLSLAVAGGAAIVAWTLAVILGGLAAWSPGTWLARLVGYGLDLLQTIPFILLAVSLAAVFEAQLVGLAILLGIAAAPAPARLVIAEMQAVRNSRFVRAQRAFGHPPGLLFRTAYLPRLIVPPLLWLLLLLPELLTVDAGLALFGLGAQPPTPTLGRLIYDGLNQAQAGWWLPFAPASVLLTLVVFAHFVATRLRGILQPAK
jgi:peptide/nickel transport system permease protein